MIIDKVCRFVADEVKHVAGQAKYYVDYVKWKPKAKVIDQAVESRLAREGVSFRHLNRELVRYKIPQKFPNLLAEHKEMVYCIDDRLEVFLRDPQNRELGYDQRRAKLIDTLARKVAEEW